MKNIHLMVIDPENDFCYPTTRSLVDYNDPNPNALATVLIEKGSALYVDGAEHDMERLATMIRRIGNKIYDIHVTIDSHHYFDIAHPVYWKNSEGKHPSPFTIITLNDVLSGKWTPTYPSFYKRTEEYVRNLEVNNRYPLCIWPPHCLIGSWGQGIYEPLYLALLEWECKNKSMVNYVTKGSNIFTEHYSAVKADVPDPSDATTQINTGLIKTLENADIILLAGEAGSHCLANTVRDIANEFGNQDYIKKMVLLTDATSPVKGFEKFQTDFISEMTSRGMQLSTTVDFLK